MDTTVAPATSTDNPNYKKRSTSNASLCWRCRYATGAPLDTKSPSYARWASAQLAEYPQTNNNKSYTYAGQEEFEKRHAARYKNELASKVISPVVEDSLPKVCPWMRNFTPIAGWEATPSTYTNAGSGCGVVESFQIKSCPLYSPDLYAQVEMLSSVELAARLGIPKSLVNRTRIGSQYLLYYCVRCGDYYCAILNNYTQQHLINRALDPTKSYNSYEASEEGNLPSPLLSTTLSVEFTPIKREILEVALNELLKQFIEDNADCETKRNTAVIAALDFIKTSLKKIEIRAQKKAEKEAAKAAKKAAKKIKEDESKNEGESENRDEVGEKINT